MKIKEKQKKSFNNHFQLLLGSVFRASIPRVFLFHYKHQHQFLTLISQSEIKTEPAWTNGLSSTLVRETADVNCDAYMAFNHQHVESAADNKLLFTYFSFQYFLIM